MNSKLDAALVKKYPKIFSERFGDPKQTLMCWGFECGDGWYNIIDVLCGKIQETIDHHNNHRKSNLEFNQMLEDSKHGDFRTFNEFYYWVNSDERKEQLMNDLKDAIPREELPTYNQVTASQVKEKFGELRFYVDNATPEIYNYIAFAEAMSHKTCEICGSPGKLYTKGWHKTLCEIHASKNALSVSKQTGDKE